MCSYRNITNSQIQHFPKNIFLDEVQLCYVLSIYLITLFLDSKTINYIMFVKKYIGKTFFSSKRYTWDIPYGLLNKTKVSVKIKLAPTLF